MTNEQRKDFYMNRNIKLIPTYLALTFDVMLVWTISIMFFTEYKGLNYTQTVALDSILMLIGCVFCLVFGKLFAKVSPITASRIGNFGYAGYLLLCIFGTNYFTFIIAQFFLAFGYSIKSIKDNLILTESLHHVKRDKDYERVYGSSFTILYVFDAIGAIFITYIYEWNGYAAYWISLGIVVLVTLFSFLIKNPRKFPENNIKIDAKQENIAKKQVKSDGYLKILSSAFVLSLIIYAFLFRGVISVDTSMFKIFLQDRINSGMLPLWSFGYIYAGARICVAIASKYQFKYNLKFGLRSIIIFNVLLIGTYLLNAILYITMASNPIVLVIIVILSYIQISLRIPNQIFLNNYMQVCVPKRNVEKAYAIRSTVEYLGYSLMSFVYSALLGVFNNDYGKSALVYVCIFAVPLIISMIFFVRQLTKKYAEKYTIIKDEYIKD